MDFLLKTIGEGGGKHVATLVIFVACVAVYPDECYVVAFELRDELLPKVDVEDLGAICLSPAIISPRIKPTLVYGIGKIF